MPFIDKVVDTALPFGMGLINGIFGDQRQLRQQERLQRLQIEGSKELSEFNRQQQMKMWLDTNYPAQVQQLKLAGLNPGLLYGHSGPGGTTGSPQASVQGAQAATSGGQEIAQFLGIGMQKEMLQAQKELIQAQAENVKADTAKKTGVDTQEAETRIMSLTQGINNAKAQEAMTRAETALRAMELEVGKHTQQDREDFIYYQTKQAMYAVGEAERQEFISRATMNSKVDIIRAEAIGALLTNELTKTNVLKTEQDIKHSRADIIKMTTELAQGWQQLSNDQRKIKIQEFEANLKSKYPGLMNVAGGVASGVVDTILGWFDKLEKIVK